MPYDVEINNIVVRVSGQKCNSTKLINILVDSVGIK